VTLGALTDEQIGQMRQWYADPLRNLPRKVTADVSALLGHIASRDTEIARLRERCEMLSDDSVLMQEYEKKCARVAQLEAVVLK